MENAGPKLHQTEEDEAREVFTAQGESAVRLPSSRMGFPSGKAHGNKKRLAKTIGLVMVVACICLVWTLWLLLLNISPNYTVNRVMGTETFDYGSFWLFVDPSKALLVLAALGLSIVAVGYVGVLVKLMFCRRKSTKQQPQTRQSINKINVLKKVESSLHDAAALPSKSRVASATIGLAVSLSQPGSSMSKFFKLGVKFVDLALEVLLLHQFLESGSPIVLVAIFTVIVACNALSCASMMFIPHERAPHVEIFIDILFDFLIVVGYPMLVVIYCLSTFSFNRAELAINLAVFPLGWFEQDAMVIADPAETAIIYQALKTLRIMSVLNLFTRIGVNFTLCFRLWRVAELVQARKKQNNSQYPKRNRPVAAFLIIFAILLIIFVEESLRTSSLACKQHPECVVNARRWTILDNSSLTQCPCLILIDRDIAPKTYAEWMSPKNVTANVVQLATTGDLQTLQLTNRFLPIFPDELRRCTDLRHISLEYTHTQTFPSWANEFTKLEFLHVESKFFSPMVVLPDNMFDDMSSLTFIHFGAFIPMAKLPSFAGLTNLKSLTLAVFLFLEELPSFDNLVNLERLVLVSLPSVNSLPDFASIKNLKSFATFDRGTWCCNGFLGDCDLSDGKCGVHPVWGTPAATCVNSTNKATDATIAVTKEFGYSICGEVLEPDAVQGTPTEETMAICRGTMYRQCNNPNETEAMCYNVRYMGITCTPNPYAIEMRRRQIAQNVGDKCDPEVEAWLGCK